MRAGLSELTLLGCSFFSTLWWYSLGNKCRFNKFAGPVSGLVHVAFTSSDAERTSQLPTSSILAFGAPYKQKVSESLYYIAPPHKEDLFGGSYANGCLSTIEELGTLFYGVGGDSVPSKKVDRVMHLLVSSSHRPDLL